MNKELNKVSVDLTGSGDNLKLGMQCTHNGTKTTTRIEKRLSGEEMRWLLKSLAEAVYESGPVQP